MISGGRRNGVMVGYLPLYESLVYRLPRLVSLRQVPPRSTAAGDPQDSVEQLTRISPWSPHVGLLLRSKYEDKRSHSASVRSYRRMILFIRSPRMIRYVVPRFPLSLLCVPFLVISALYSF